MLRGFTLIDGTGAPAVENALIAIRDGRIFKAGLAGDFILSKEIDVIEMDGHWVLPGFVDMHVHMPEPPYEDADDGPEVLKTLLAFGVTAVRNVGASDTAGVELKQRINRGELLGPLYYTSGPILLAEGGAWEGTEFGVVVRQEDDVRREIGRQAALGVDFIKVYQGLTPRLVSVAIEEAHALGLKVVGHMGRANWVQAAEMGIDAVTHFNAGFMTSAVPKSERAEFEGLLNRRVSEAKRGELYRNWLQVMARSGPEVDKLSKLLVENGVEANPTMAVFEATTFGDDPTLLDHLEPKYALPSEQKAWIGRPNPYSADWSPATFDAARRVFSIFQKLLKVMHDRGVLITAGTDIMNPWMTAGVSFHRELQLLSSADITPLEVITIATRNGAQALGLLEDFGTVEEGKRANLVILSADPTVNIENTRTITDVYLNGEQYSPQILLGR